MRNTQYYKIPLDYKQITKGKGLQKIDLEASLSRYISLIITTIFGEYKYDTDFGTAIWEADFDLLTNSNHLKSTIKTSVFEKISQYEKRLVVTEVITDISEETFEYYNNIRAKRKLVIEVSGVIKKENTPFSYMSSYYLAPFSSK